ncbi:MAG: hypothetical protein WD295_06030, partial [Bacteroidota bacterium]
MRRTLMVAGFMAISVVGYAQGVMENIGNWNGRSSPAGGYGPYSACWGYTAPDGREYALLGSFQGTSIIDITDAPELKEVAFIPGPESSWREMKTYREYAFIVSEGTTLPDPGVQIIDLSELPDTARLVEVFVWVDPSTQASHPRAHSVSV